MAQLNLVAHMANGNLSALELLSYFQVVRIQQDHILREESQTASGLDNFGYLH
jgi:hypothetical protein